MISKCDRTDINSKPKSSAIALDFGNCSCADKNQSIFDLDRATPNP
ncbi:hypothetical protein [Nostoc sp.]